MVNKSYTPEEAGRILAAARALQTQDWIKEGLSEVDEVGLEALSELAQNEGI
jgi:hypothetical protein